MGERATILANLPPILLLIMYCNSSRSVVCLEQDYLSAVQAVRRPSGGSTVDVGQFRATSSVENIQIVEVFAPAVSGSSQVLASTNGDGHRWLRLGFGHIRRTCSIALEIYRVRFQRLDNARGMFSVLPWRR